MRTRRPWPLWFPFGLAMLLAVSELIAQLLARAIDPNALSAGWLSPSAALVHALSLGLVLRWAFSTWSVEAVPPLRSTPPAGLGGSALLGLFGYAPLAYLVDCVFEIAQRLFPAWDAPRLALDTVGPETVGQALATAGFVLLVAPLSEELAFRELAFSRVRHALGVRSAVWTSALAFALVHGDLAVSSLALCAGGWFGATRARSRGPWSAVAQHLGFNCSALLLPFPGRWQGFLNWPRRLAELPPSWVSACCAMELLTMAVIWQLARARLPRAQDIGAQTPSLGVKRV